MIKKALRATGRGVKTLAQKTHTKVTTYLGKRPHRSFRKTKNPRQKLGGKKLPGVWSLLADTNRFLLREKWLYFKLAFLFALFKFLLVGGVSQLDFLGFKDSTLQFFGGDFDSFGNSLALFVAAVTGSLGAPVNELQQFLGWLLGFIFWLAMIWAARMRLAGNVVKARDALYNACAPLISSSVLVLIVVFQLLPAAGSVFLFAVLQTSGVIEGGVEVMMFSLAAAFMFLLSSYWLAASLLSLVVVTLPGMYPWKALQSASELIIGQRWAVALRMAVLAVIILVIWGIVLLPALLLDGYLRLDWLPIVPIVFQLLAALSLVYGSVYVYKLYRSLL
jgi:hypothetical protein